MTGRARLSREEWREKAISAGISLLIFLPVACVMFPFLAAVAPTAQWEAQGVPALAFPAALAVTSAVCVGVIDLLQIRSIFQAFLLTTAVVFAGFIVCSHTLNLSVPKRCVDVKTLTVAATRDCQEPARRGRDRG